MKKILILLAATMLLFACGGNSGKKSEKKTVEETVEETAVNYLKKLMKAQDAYDYQAAEKIFAEMQESAFSVQMKLSMRAMLSAQRE